MFSKLLRLTSFKSIVRVAVDQRVEAWARALMHWELAVSLLAEIFLVFQFLLVYGSVTRNLAQFGLLSLIILVPLVWPVLDKVRIF
jgi:hypothetical protein